MTKKKIILLSTLLPAGGLAIGAGVAIPLILNKNNPQILEEAEIIYDDYDPNTHTCSVKLNPDKPLSKSGIAHIPSTMKINGEDYTVNEIADDGFAYISELTKAVLPNTITKIGDSAFRECSELNEINIPTSVTSIGGLAFANCGKCNFTSSESNENFLHEGLKEIGGSAFNNCAQISKVILPSTLTSLGDNAFDMSGASGSKLQSIVVKESSITSISTCCFYSCPISEDVVLPSNIVSVGNYAFSGAQYKTLTFDSTQLGDIVEENDKTTLYDSPATVYVKEDQAGTWTPGATTTLAKNFDKESSSDKPGYYKFVAKQFKYELNSTSDAYKVSVGKVSGDITIPSSYSGLPVNEIADFENAEMTSVTIPSSITKLDDGCFERCESLKTVIFQTTSITEIPQYAFNACSSLESINIPENVTTIGDLSLAWCENLTTLSLPSTITEIHRRAFYNCAKIDANKLTFAGSNTYTIEKYKGLWGEKEETVENAFNPNSDKAKALQYLVGINDESGQEHYFQWTKNS